jgi:CubicO group peptidase (beta-lactamase class C family)
VSAGVKDISPFQDPVLTSADLPATTRVLGKCADRGWHGSVALSVVRAGRLLVDTAWGDTAPGVPADGSTAFAWTCAGKLLTAAAIGTLHDAGALRLDDPIRTHVPAFRPDSGRHHRIADLLRHRVPFDGDPGTVASGLPDWRDALPTVTADSAHDGRSSYTIWSANLVLAAVIEAASGRRYEDYVTAAVLDPLDSDAVLAVRPGLGAPLYRRSRSGTTRHPLDDERATGRIWPGVSVRGRTRDLVGLLSVFQPGARPVLSSGTSAAMIRRDGADDVEADGLNWGLGVAVDRRLATRDFSDRTFGHHGLGGSAIACGDPDSGLLLAVAFDTTLDGLSGAVRRDSVVQALHTDLTEAGVA